MFLEAELKKSDYRPEDLPAVAQWRRLTGEMYSRIRTTNNPRMAWQEFKETRDALFKNHSQSPLDANQRSRFEPLRYFPYDPAFRLTGRLDYDTQVEELEIDTVSDGLLHLRRISVVNFELFGWEQQLSLFWVQGYGGGLFLPFKDSTNQTETYGGGRYLYDTIKGADLGVNQDEIILDFNFAYNPSCAYNAHWVCPLAPRENRLNTLISAGEKQFVNTIKIF